jgi:nucleoside-diphosphate-sugar epimerase
LINSLHTEQRTHIEFLSKMKIILAGATGFVGKALVQNCNKDSRITAIVALSRRDLPPELTANNDKVKVLIHQNFLEYPDSVLDELAGAEACLWYAYMISQPAQLLFLLH